MSIERSIPELEAWYAQYDDARYRRESPDAYHHELIRTAEALRDDGAIDMGLHRFFKRTAMGLVGQGLERQPVVPVDDPDA